MMIKIKRIYERAESDDGYKILVDRLWPRGIKKEDAQIDLWLKDIAPSDELRKWFAHKDELWPDFKKKYFKELEHKQDLVDQIREALKDNKIVTFVFSAKDEEHNNAVALKEYIEAKKREVVCEID